MIFTKKKIFNFMLFYKVNFVSKNGRSKSIWIDFCDRPFLNKVGFDLMASFLFWNKNFFQFRLRIAMPRGHFSDFGDSAGTSCWQSWKPSGKLTLWRTRIDIFVILVRQICQKKIRVSEGMTVFFIFSFFTLVQNRFVLYKINSTFQKKSHSDQISFRSRKSQKHIFSSKKMTLPWVQRTSQKNKKNKKKQRNCKNIQDFYSARQPTFSHHFWIIWSS